AGAVDTASTEPDGSTNQSVRPPASSSRRDPSTSNLTGRDSQRSGIGSCSIVTGSVGGLARLSAESAHGRGLSSLPSVLTLTKAQARRIAVRAQLLDAPRPTDLLEVVQHLTLLQIDPTGAVAPSADLVAWSRLGSSHRPE